MKTTRTVTTSALAAALAFAMAGTALAKGHDQGVADGTRTDPSTLRGGGVAGADLAGVGRPDPEGPFLGVADADHDLTYGQDVVANQRATDTRRVKPCRPDCPIE